MKYASYRPNCERMARELIRHKIVSRKLTSIKAIEETIRRCVCGFEGYLQTLDFLIQAEEYRWIMDNMTMYYPETIDMAESLLKAKSTVNDSTAFYDGNECFVLNFPIGFKLAGRQASGVLITVAKHKERVEWIFDPFQQVLGIELDFRGNFDDENVTIMCSYQDHLGKKELYIRFCVESAMLKKITESKNWEEGSKIFSTFNEFDYQGGQDLNAEDEAYQWELMRIVANFLLYKKSCKDRIRKGLPGIKAKEVETPLLKNKNHITIKGPKGGGLAAAAHYVTWHFRQLSHKKYYQNQYAHLSPGSRVVFVSDYYAGAKPDAFTVE